MRPKVILQILGSLILVIIISACACYLAFMTVMLVLFFPEYQVYVFIGALVVIGTAIFYLGRSLHRDGKAEFPNDWSKRG
ncbi:hypothetical protein, partial [Polynucleobacter sp.]|uniref:hypothetical protein n=1 Tax=Polynucleobacter sp. TaxID=2029855 RepID=UPI003F696F0F